MNRDRFSRSEQAIREDELLCNPSQEDDNAHDTVWDRQDTATHYPSSMGKIPTETLHSSEDLFASTLMDRKPSARPKEHKGTRELRHAHSQPFLARLSEDHPQPKRLASFGNQKTLTLESTSSHHRSLESTSSHHRPRAWNRCQIELLPDYYVSLVGSEETWQAFCEDNVIHAECSSCQMFLYCKDTACMVICPSCRMISPIGKVGLRTERLGLGLSVEVAFEMLKS
jgi:hypothetical protein